MGGGQRLFILIGAGAGEGASFLGGSNSSLKKKFKPSRSGKIKNICDNKRLPQKLLWGASPIMFPPHAENETPPPHTEKWHCPHVERTDCPHRKNTPIGESPPPPHGFFLFMLHPLASAYITPCVRRS